MENESQVQQKQQKLMNNQPEEFKVESEFIDCHDLPVDKLLELGQENYEKMNMEDAEYYFEEALSKDPKNEKILSVYSEFLFNNDQSEKARQLLELALKLYPKTIYYKMYFSLAQIHNGKIGIQLYQKGIERILQKQKNQLQSEEIEEIQKDLAMAYSAIAEIYQTDFLHLPESEPQVLENIKLAIQIDPYNLDALLQITNYHLNKENLDHAQQCLQLLINTLSPHLQQSQQETKNIQITLDYQLLQNLIPGFNNVKTNIQQSSQSLSPQYKIQVIKLCIELEMYSQGIPVCEDLILENKENIEAYYLLAFLLFKMQKYEESKGIIEELTAYQKEQQVEIDQELHEALEELKLELLKFNTQEVQGQQEEGEWMDLEEDIDYDDEEQMKDN